MRVAAAILLCLAAAGAAAAEAFPAGVFGAVFSQFNLDAPSDDLINSDFLIGVPLAARRGLLAGIDVKGFEETDRDAGASGKLGLQFGAPHPARRGLSVFLLVYEGFAPFGKFPSTEVRYYGASLQFDF